MSGQRKKPVNAFRASYLAAVREEDEPMHGSEVEFGGPWLLSEEEGEYALFRVWESLESGDIPEARFSRREIALIFQIVWPAVGRERLFRFVEEGERQEDEGYAVESEGERVARLRLPIDEILFAAHVLSCIIRSPLSLALAMEAAGPEAQERVGQILGRQVKPASRTVGAVTPAAEP